MPMRRAAFAALVTLLVLGTVACSSKDGQSAPPHAAEPTGSGTVASTSPSTPGSASAASAPALGDDSTVPALTPSSAVPGSEPTTSPSTTTGSPTKTVPPTTVDDQFIETRLLGRSVEGRPIMAERRGTPGGRVVLVIGVIHGNEDAGAAILDDLHTMRVPDGVDLWLVDSMNPDGVVADDRHNAHGVDLNRNFPYAWSEIGEKGDDEWSGPSPASEPETQAMVSFITDIRPDLTMWYHQDLYRVQPGSGRGGRISARYAQLTGLPIEGISGGTYTGVAATWVRHTVSPGVAFIVELGPTLSDDEARMHAQAVLTIAEEER